MRLGTTRDLVTNIGSMDSNTQRPSKRVIMAVANPGDRRSDPIWGFTRDSRVPFQAPYRIIYPTWILEQSVLSPTRALHRVRFGPRMVKKLGRFAMCRSNSEKTCSSPTARLPRYLPIQAQDDQVGGGPAGASLDLHSRHWKVHRDCQLLVPLHETIHSLGSSLVSVLQRRDTSPPLPSRVDACRRGKE